VAENTTSTLGDAEEQHRRHAWQQRHEAEHAGDQAQRLAICEHLITHLLAESGFGRALGDEDAGRGRDEQARNLRDEAITDREDRVLEEGLLQLHVAIDHRHDQAASDVDRRDDQAGDRVAAHELAGAVHRTVELHLGR
jgi:hypothetical protein